MVIKLTLSDNGKNISISKDDTISIEFVECGNGYQWECVERCPHFVKDYFTNYLPSQLGRLHTLLFRSGDYLLKLHLINHNVNKHVIDKYQIKFTTLG